jgi:DNA-binding CsgD family transcriptional regulator
VFVFLRAGDERLPFSNSDLIDRIYEAAVLPEGWRTIIGDLSNHLGGKGGLLFTSSLDDFRWMGTGETEENMEDFVAQGWHLRNDRVPRLVAMRYPGFITDTDVMSETEIATHPMYTEFLSPRGYSVCAGTAIQGATGDLLIFSIEGLSDYGWAKKIIPHLDTLRPHLARAAMLTSQIRLERAKAATVALEMIGTPAAFVSGSGRLRSANRLFQSLIGTDIVERVERLKIADTQADLRFASALEQAKAGAATGISIALKQTPERGAAVLHMLPVLGEARDVFWDGGFILVLSRPGTGRQLKSEVLQSLYDLTPAEARLARALANGLSPDEIAAQAGTTIATVRSQLKSLFVKLGVNRQAQLVSLLAGLVLPG